MVYGVILALLKGARVPEEAARSATSQLVLRTLHSLCAVFELLQYNVGYTIFQNGTYSIEQTEASPNGTCKQTAKKVTIWLDSTREVSNGLPLVL